MIHSFPPVVDADCRVLILGSMPSVVSLERQQYYGHRQNYFWPMLYELFDEPFCEDYEERKALLLRHHIALWDVIAGCERQGSLDSNITNEVPNAIPQLLEQYPSIRVLLFNGGKAYDSFRKAFPELLENVEWYRMPSTSPAHTMKREEKRKKWQILPEFCK